MKWLILGLMLVFLMVRVLPTAAQDATPQPLAVPTPDVVATAQTLVERAEAVQEQTLNSINSFMASIQVLSGILGIVFAVIAYVNFRQTAELSQRIKDEINPFVRSLSLTQFGLRQVDMGNYVVASEIFREANKLNPNNPVIRYFTGDLYLRIGNIREGKRNLKFAIENGDSPSAKASYAYALRLEGDQDELGRDERYKQAEKYFLEVCQQDKNLLDISGESAFGALAGLYKRQGNYKDAMKYYKHCASITPRSSYAVNNLGLLYYRFGEQMGLSAKEALEKAREYFEQSKANALYAVKLSSADYWRFFDLITAGVALNEPFDDIQGHITQAFNRKPLDSDVNKLLGGLEELEKAPNPPKDIKRVIGEIKKRAAMT